MGKKQLKHTTIRLIPLKTWLVTLACGLSLLALILWSVFGTISSSISGTGILLPLNDQMYPATSQFGGIIQKLMVKRGSIVQKGNVLAYLSSSQTGNTFQETAVYSPINGRVISIGTVVGKYVGRGESIMILAPDTKKLSVFALFNAFDGKKIQKNMPALIAPSYVSQYQYGVIKGTVKHVEEYPADKTAILSVIIDPSWLHQLGYRNNAMLIANVSLQTDEHTVSGYRWTSKAGPPIKISPGSFVHVSVNVKKVAPITLVIPILKRWLS